MTSAKTFYWIFIELVSAVTSTYAIDDQIQKINALNELVKVNTIFNKMKSDATLFLSHGECIAIGFNTHPEIPVLMAIELHKSIFKYNLTKNRKSSLQIVTGIHQTSVYSLKDFVDKEIFWSPDFTIIRNFMKVGGRMHILASAKYSEDIHKLTPEYKEIFHPLGEYEMLDGRKMQLYNLYGDKFGNKIPPKKYKIIKQNEGEQDLLSANLFEFEYIELDLDIKNTKSMQVHHTLLWNIVNHMKGPVTHISYYLDGNTPVKFEKMNVKITDKKGNGLKIASINVNKPYHKEFYVELKEPIPPEHKTGLLKLEYDWPAPDRSEFYKLSAGCKKFKYRLTIPKKYGIKNKILKVDPELGTKWNITPPPKIRYLDETTEITWEGKDLKAYFGYLFKW
jgi:hypothetical protein